MGEIETSEERATLTFWIPERVDALLSEHERRKGISRSDGVRAILRQYLYGLFGELPSSHVRAHANASGRARGLWGGRTPELGKNTVEVKLSLPRAWRDDLADVATVAGITLSHFAREVVVTHLFGHAYLPARVVHLNTDAAEQD